ncbi:MAG TPA: hypothetical protein VFX39_05545, partial [Gemmatimonadaceae bacterium]|nr:hypothetical protein [Gemmatimonadaceae bacterium]
DVLRSVRALGVRGAGRALGRRRASLRGGRATGRRRTTRRTAAQRTHDPQDLVDVHPVEHQLLLAQVAALLQVAPQ